MPSTPAFPPSLRGQILVVAPAPQGSPEQVATQNQGLGESQREQDLQSSLSLPSS